MEQKEYLFSNRDLKKLIFPLLVEQLLAVTVGLTDSIMVASVGESAVSAVSLVDNINILLIGLFSALATGGAVVAGQYIGHGDRKKACTAGEQMLVFVFAMALGIMALIYLGKFFILNIVFGQISQEVHDYADTYLMIVMASIPFLALYNCGAALFRVQGNSQISMQTSLLMNSINIIGNAVMIFGLHCKVEGVAIPTLVSRVIAAFVIVILLRNQELEVHISKPFRYRFLPGMVKRILQIGVPNGVENSMFQLGKLVLLSLISTFGTTAIAANAVSNSVAAFEILPGQAVGLALVTVISQCVGAGDYQQVRYYTKKLMGYTYIAMIALNILILFGLPIIMNVYHLSAETTKVTTQILLLHGVCAMVIWPLSFTFPNTLRAANDVKYTMIVSMVSMWFCRIILGFVLGKYMGFGVLGTWMAMILDWCVRSVFFVIHYYRGKWMEKKVVL
ncbi:MAG: MATE family efflux transporter [Lachnospiraceae bacterium]|nr:MATE family efflux transporter [Lachnospiraceae bacterium]